VVVTGWVLVDDEEEDDDDDELGTADHPDAVGSVAVGVDFDFELVLDFAVEAVVVRLEALAEVDAADDPTAICAPIPTNAVTLSELLRKLRFVLTKEMLALPADAPLRPT